MVTMVFRLCHMRLRDCSISIFKYLFGETIHFPLTVSDNKMCETKFLKDEILAKINSTVLTPEKSKGKWGYKKMQLIM